MPENPKKERTIQVLDKIGFFVEMVSGACCVVLFAAMTLVMLLGVFYRYVLNDPFVWTEEAARFLMLWLGFLAINIALRKNEHIYIDIVVNALPAKVSKVLDYMVQLMIGYLLMVLLIKGYLMSANSLMSAAIIPVSMCWIYLSVPIGALLTLIQLTLNLAKKILKEFEAATARIP